jgi:hypothetical protein
MTTVAVLVGIVLVLAAVFAVAPTWARAAGLDVWNLRSVRAEQAAAAERRGELEDQHDRLWQQVGAGDLVVDRLVEGKLGLAEAVEELSQINADRPGFVIGLRCHHRDLAVATDRELVGVYAVDKAGRRLKANEDDRREAVLARLNAELKALAGR